MKETRKQIKRNVQSHSFYPTSLHDSGTGELMEDYPHLAFQSQEYELDRQGENIFNIESCVEKHIIQYLESKYTD